MPMKPGEPAPTMKPYLINAVLEYCRDHALTPYLLVHVDDACQVPEEYVRNNSIVFDISDEAIHNFGVSDEELTFQARFGEDNAIFTVVVPLNRIFAITPLEYQELAIQFEVTPSVKKDASEQSAEPAPQRRPMRVK